MFAVDILPADFVIESRLLAVALLFLFCCFDEWMRDLTLSIGRNPPDWGPMFICHECVVHFDPLMPPVKDKCGGTID